jgi:hypothetical protein
VTVQPDGDAGDRTNGHREENAPAGTSYANPEVATLSALPVNPATQPLQNLDRWKGQPTVGKNPEAWECLSARALETQLRHVDLNPPSQTVEVLNQGEQYAGKPTGSSGLTRLHQCKTSSCWSNSWMLPTSLPWTQFKDHLLSFSDVFAVDATELGSTDLTQHSIKTGDHPPIKQSPPRIPFTLRQMWRSW